MMMMTITEEEDELLILCPAQSVLCRMAPQNTTAQ